MATRPGENRAYVLLGSGFIRAFSIDDPGKFVENWFPLHPNATYTTISSSIFTNIRTHIKSEIDYIWVEDGADALNVDLIRQGVYQGETMFDMVDNARGLDRLLRSDPKLAQARATIEKERAAAPEDRSERLITEDDYKSRMLRIEKAATDARAEKLGIWSDAMKDEREAEGLP